MRQLSRLEKRLISKSFPQSLGSISLIGLAISSLVAIPHPSIASEASIGEAPVPKGETEVSPQLVIPENHRTDMPALAPQPITTGKNTFIDTKNYEPPSEVIVTERGSNCQTIARGGQLVGGRCAVTAIAPRQRVSRVAKPLAPVDLTAVRPPRDNAPAVARQSRRYPVIANNPVRRYASTLIASSAPVHLAPPQVIESNVVALNPPEWNGVKLALAPVTSAEIYPTTEPASIERATRLRPTVNEQPRRTDLLFPLAIPAQITSAFGWREHPITGNRTIHSGTDLGAPIGTPVLAAYPGEVAMADWSAGYGLMIVLRHLDGTQESRYAHLSEIDVTPGQWVEQGTVIGRVGSTGLSTGPHLHFEWRHLTEQGWTAVDAGLHLEFALENLIDRMQMATSTEPNKG